MEDELPFPISLFIIGDSSVLQVVVNVALGGFYARTNVENEMDLNSMTEIYWLQEN